MERNKLNHENNNIISTSEQNSTSYLFQGIFHFWNLISRIDVDLM